MPPVAAAAAQYGAFTTAQALHAGWTPSSLRHALRTDRLVRLRTGVYAWPVVPSGDRYADRSADLVLQAAAVGLTNRRVPISHAAGGLLHGLSLVRVPDRVCVTFPRGRRDTIPGVHRHRGRLAPGDVQRRGTVHLLSPARTVVDIGCEAGADDAIVAADSALRLGLVDPVDLHTALERAAGWPGVRGAQLAVPLADARAESALESISRLRIAAAGLPMPESQVVIRTAGGRFAGRVDFYWDEFGVVGEADGMRKYDGEPLSLVAEKRRQLLLEECELIVVRWGWADLFPFDATAARLARAFARAQRADRPARRWLADRTWPRTGVVG